MISVSYKRIVANVTGHLLQRLVYHRSKGRFTSSEGKVLAAECRLWIQAGEIGLTSNSGVKKVRRPEVAWAKLVDAATLLSVGEGEFPDVVQAVFDGGRARYDTVSEALGLSGALGREEAQDVLKARVEAPRR